MKIKKLPFLLAFGVFLIVLFSSCGTGVDVSQMEEGIEEARISNIGISARVDSLEKEGKSLYLNVVYQNNSSKDVVYDKEPRLEMLVDGSWYEVKMKDEASWDAVGIVIIQNTTSEEKIDLNLYYDKLRSGHYRYLKRIDSFYRAAEFDI